RPLPRTHRDAVRGPSPPDVRPSRRLRTRCAVAPRRSPRVRGATTLDARALPRPCAYERWAVASRGRAAGAEGRGSGGRRPRAALASQGLGVTTAKKAGREGATTTGDRRHGVGTKLARS